MLRREMGCSSRGTILGSIIDGIVPNERARPAKPLIQCMLDGYYVCYHRPMIRSIVLASVVGATAGTDIVAVEAADDPLSRARVLYNQGQFEAAVNAAELARLTPGRTDSADLVAARAYLERFRVSAASDDLTNARERLRRLDPLKFQPRERLEYIVGLGETLFFDQAYGAAAAVFDSVLKSGELMTGDSRDRV